MKRRSLLALLVSPLVSPLLKRASGACSPKKSVFHGPFKVEINEKPIDIQLTLEDLRAVKKKLEMFRVPQFRGHYWFDLKKNDWMGTEDFKDLIENEKIRL